MPEAENLDKRVSGANQISDSSETDANAQTHVSPDHHGKDTRNITSKHKAPLIGSVVGGVKIDDFIGSGGMSQVYHGFSGTMEVAIKVLLDHHMDDERAIKRFEEDGLATTTLRHANIVETLAAGREEKIPYIVYRYVKGATTLTSAPLTMEENASVLLQMAHALKYAHSIAAGKPQIIHRDVKPDNILVQKKPLHAYLIDFGIGKNMDKTHKGVTQEKMFLGTPFYMAPEQAADAKDVGPKADVYAWACTAYNAHSKIPPTEKRTFVSDNLSFEQRMERIGDRLNDQMTHELWLNEAIEEGLKERTSAFDPAVEKDKAHIEAIQKRTGRASDDYEELIHRVLCAKNPTERPNFSMIIPRLDSLIEKNLVRARELTEAEKTQQAEIITRLKTSAETERVDIKKMDEKDKAGIIEKKFLLGRTLTSLSDILPFNDESREELYQEAVKHLTDVYSEANIASRAAVPSTKVGVQDAEEYKSWAASGLRVVQERKKRRATRMSEHEYDALFTKAAEALKDDRLADAAGFYKQIDQALMPSSSKTKMNSMTQTFEAKITEILLSGEKLLENDVEAAVKQYNRAEHLSAVLPEASDGRKWVAGFYLLTEFNKLDRDYKNAETHSDFYSMLKTANDMSKLLENPLFTPEKKEVYAGRVEKHLEVLKTKKGHIGVLDELIKSTDELVDELAKEVQEKTEAEVESSIRFISKERIDYYKGSLEGITTTFFTLKRENIGPKYDGLKKSLDVLKDDLQVEVWKRGVGNGTRAESYDCLNALINHYDAKENKSKEMFYLHLRVGYDKKRLDELKGNA